MSNLSNTQRFLSFFIADGDPPALIVPQHVIEEGPEAVQSFTESYDDLAKGAAPEMSVEG